MASKSATGKELGRTPEKRRGILKAITAKIVSGEWPLGQKIPNRLSIEKTFNASSVTVQRAMEILATDGFLEPRGRSGTFVSENPPFLHNYGIVYYGQPKKNWSAFLESIDIEAAKLKLDSRTRLKYYYELNGDPRMKDYGRLISDIRAHRLAGIFFTTNPYQVADTPITDEGDLPRVVISNSRPNNKFANILLDGHSVVEMGVSYLADKGCRKIGVFASTQQADEFIPIFRKLVSSKGCECRDEWIQTAHTSSPSSAVNVVRLMMKLDRKNIPDGIYVADDNLTASVIEGLEESGVRIPQDLVVASHSNFPATFKHPASVKLFGFNIRRVLKEAIKLMEMRKHGKKLPATTFIKACSDEEFEKEYASNS